MIEDPLNTYPSPPLEDFYASLYDQSSLAWTHSGSKSFATPASTHIPHRNPTPGTAHTERAFVDAILDLLDSSLFLLDELVIHEQEILESIFGTNTDTA